MSLREKVKLVKKQNRLKEKHKFREQKGKTVKVSWPNYFVEVWETITNKFEEYLSKNYDVLVHEMIKKEISNTKVGNLLANKRANYIDYWQNLDIISLDDIHRNLAYWYQKYIERNGRMLNKFVLYNYKPIFFMLPLVYTAVHKVLKDMAEIVLSSSTGLVKSTPPIKNPKGFTFSSKIDGEIVYDEMEGSYTRVRIPNYSIGNFIVRVFDGKEKESKSNKLMYYFTRIDTVTQNNIDRIIEDETEYLFSIMQEVGLQPEAIAEKSGANRKKSFILEKLQVSMLASIETMLEDYRIDFEDFIIDNYYLRIRNAVDTIFGTDIFTKDYLGTYLATLDKKVYIVIRFA